MPLGPPNRRNFLIQARRKSFLEKGLKQSVIHEEEEEHSDHEEGKKDAQANNAKPTGSIAVSSANSVSQRPAESS